MAIPTSNPNAATTPAAPRRTRRRLRVGILVGPLVVLVVLWAIEQMGALPPFSAVLDQLHLQHPRRFAQLTCLAIVLVGALLALKVALDFQQTENSPCPTPRKSVHTPPD
jgi:hypothetical protein